MTVDELCAALKHFLTEASQTAASGGLPPSKLQLWGVPGDDVMRAVMLATGGTLTITVNEVPEELAVGMVPPAPNGTEFGGILDYWSPG